MRDRYIDTMQKLQRTYWLEPAGSRGVWGLDDYHFLPFLWGSAQLTGHKHFRPRSVRYKETVDGFADQYLYFSAIKAVNEVCTD